MIDVAVNVRIDGAMASLQRIARLDTRRVFMTLRAPARQDQRDHDKKESAPGGHWPGLAASTLARRTRKRGRNKAGKQQSWPQKLLGRLPRALQAIVSTRSLIVRSRGRSWVIVHQAGGFAGHGARIPQRQYLWISKWLRGEVRTAFLRAMSGAFHGRP